MSTNTTSQNTTQFHCRLQRCHTVPTRTDDGSSTLSAGLAPLPAPGCTPHQLHSNSIHAKL